MASRFKWALAVAMVSILILGVFGCGGDDGGTTGEDKGAPITKESFLQRVSEQSTGLETCEFIMDMTMNMDGWDGEEEQAITAKMSANLTGAMDLPAKEMKMVMAITMELPEEMQEPDMPSSVELEMYMMEDTIYMNMGEILGGWLKMGIPESQWEMAWDEQDWLNQQTDLLLKAYNVELIGEKTVNGVECYEVTMEPDMKQVFDIFGQQMGDFMPEGTDPSEFDDALDMFKSISIRQWYDKETFFPVRAEMSMSLEDEGEEVNMDMTMEMNMKYTNINKSVSIKLPDEAEDAVDMGEWSEVMG
ncbi:MAG: hypothetical protein FJZ95_08440 [Chloroflexi bacterium]|nr:hypothetical protein [Chloroflexota bacterium]